MMEKNSFAESIVRRLKNKIVEIYSGDTGTTRQYSQDSVTLKEVIRGTIVDAEGELLVIEVTNKETYGVNLVYINAWNIRIIVEPKNGMSITDIYNGEHERIKK